MRPIGFAILTVLATAAGNLLLRGAMKVWPIGLAGTCSRVVTVAMLGAWVLSQGRGWRRLGTNGTAGALAVMGAISIAINLLWFGALKLTTATNVSLLFSTDLLFVVLIGAGLGLERIGWKQLAILPVMLTGMALLTGVTSSGWGGHVLGDMMAVGAAFAYASNAFIIRGILRKMDEEAVALYNHGISTVGFLAMVMLNREIAVAGTVMAQGTAWLWVIGFGVVAAVALPLYYAALARMEVWKLRAWLLAAPVLVALLEWLTWGVRLSTAQFLGAAMVLGGLAALVHMESRLHRRQDRYDEAPMAMAAEIAGQREG